MKNPDRIPIPTPNEYRAAAENNAADRLTAMVDASRARKEAIDVLAEHLPAANEALAPFRAAASEGRIEWDATIGDMPIHVDDRRVASLMTLLLEDAGWDACHRTLPTIVGVLHSVVVRRP